MMLCHKSMNWYLIYFLNSEKIFGITFFIIFSLRMGIFLFIKNFCCMAKLDLYFWTFMDNKRRFQPNSSNTYYSLFQPYEITDYLILSKIHFYFYFLNKTSKSFIEVVDSIVNFHYEKYTRYDHIFNLIISLLSFPFFDFYQRSILI